MNLLKLAILVASLLLSTPSLAFKNEADLSPLQENEGYLVAKITFNNPFITSESDAGIKYISLIGPKDHIFKGITIGNNTFIIKLPAGTYRWGKLVIWNGAYYSLGDDKYTARVVAGNVAYAGDIVIQNKGRGLSTFKYLNRSSTIYKHLKEHYSDFISNYTLQYTGYGADHFFNYIHNSRLTKNTANPVLSEEK